MRVETPNPNNVTLINSNVNVPECSRENNLGSQLTERSQVNNEIQFGRRFSNKKITSG